MMRRRAACLALALLACAGAWASPVPPLASWAADSGAAARANKPVLLFFTLPGCRFCEQVRQNYMQGLVKQGVMVREVSITSNHPVTGMPGAATGRAVARRFKVKVAPTVLLVDARARVLAEPIVGGDVAGLYGGYLDNAFEEAQRQLDSQWASPSAGSGREKK